MEEHSSKNKGQGGSWWHWHGRHHLAVSTFTFTFTHTLNWEFTSTLITLYCWLLRTCTGAVTLTLILTVAAACWETQTHFPEIGNLTTWSPSDHKPDFLVSRLLLPPLERPIHLLIHFSWQTFFLACPKNSDVCKVHKEKLSQLHVMYTLWMQRLLKCQQKVQYIYCSCLFSNCLWIELYASLKLCCKLLINYI